MRAASRAARAAPRRRWTWEHVALAWMLAFGIAVACTLARFPPGRPMRPVRVPPPAWRAAIGPRWVLQSARRERLLVTGWVVAPLVAACLTAGWVVHRAAARSGAARGARRLGEVERRAS